MESLFDKVNIAKFLRTPGFELTFMIHESNFKVPQMNIFQETEKSRIVVISQAGIYTKIVLTALNFR